MSDSNKIKIVNLTSKPIYILKEKFYDITLPVKQIDVENVKKFQCHVIPVSGKEAFCALQRHNRRTINDGIKLSLTSIGQETNYALPEQTEDTIYIVPNKVYESLHLFRQDIYIIDEPVKNTSGMIIACRSLTRVKYTIPNKAMSDVIADFDKILVSGNIADELYDRLSAIRLKMVGLTFKEQKLKIK